MPLGINDGNVPIGYGLAKFILTEATKLLADGSGQDLLGNEVEGLGYLEELPLEQDSTAYFAHVLRFVRYIGQIMTVAIAETMENIDPTPLLTITEIEELFED